MPLSSARTYRAALRTAALLASSAVVTVCSSGGTEEDKCSVSAVEVLPTQVTVAVGVSATLTATVTSANCSTQPTVTWSASDPGAVTLQANGNQVQVTGTTPTSIRTELASVRVPVTVAATAQEKTGSSQVTVEPAPEISLSVGALTFSAAPGGANPASQGVTITNGGGGTLSGLGVGTITYGAGATGWLQAPTLSSTTANPSATLTLQPVTGSLAAGTYTATVPITSGVASNSPRNVTVTFNLTAQTCTSIPYAIGNTVNGTLTNTDCDFGDGTFFDPYSFNATATASVRVNLSSNDFDTFMLLTDVAGNVLAVNDDGTSTTNSTFRLLLGTATYIIDANSFEVAATGNYTLTSSTIAPAVNNCEEVWVTPGISTTQAIATTDCTDATGPFYGDAFLITLRAGQSITITQTAGFDAFLLLARFDAGGTTVVASDNDSGPGTDAMITYTNTGSAAVFAIVASTNLANVTGAYTLTIQ